MKKNYLCTLFIMLTSMMSTTVSAHDLEVANADGVMIYYNYTNDGQELEVTFRGYSHRDYNEYEQSVIIPDEVTYMGITRRVTSIGGSAFMGCNNLTAVTIPNSVTTIGNSAFQYCI